MKKLLYFLSFSMIVSSAWSQTPSGCFSSGNDVSFTTLANTTSILNADFDNDGISDMVMSAFSTANPMVPRVQFHKGLGNGKFGPQIQDSAGNAIYALQNGDFNLDGYQDLVAGNNGGSGASIMRGISIHYGLGNGTFQSGTILSKKCGYNSTRCIRFKRRWDIGYCRSRK